MSALQVTIQKVIAPPTSSTALLSPNFSPPAFSISDSALPALDSVFRTDCLAREEPLEILLCDSARSERTLSITLRTPPEPGCSFERDLELVTGFLFHERLLRSKEDLVDVRFETLKRHTRARVSLSPSAALHGEGAAPIAARIAPRQTVQSSSCGACGKTSIDSVLGENAQGPTQAGFQVSSPFAREVLKYPDRLRKFQTLFEQTGGVHGCGYFTFDGELLSVREDIGRHNALDKLIGRGILDGLFPIRAGYEGCGSKGESAAAGGVLVLSGRVSFELVQKALYAGIKTIAAVGAPSSMAYDLADENGMTLIGFLRGSTYNVYTGWERGPDG